VQVYWQLLPSHVVVVLGFDGHGEQLVPQCSTWVSSTQTPAHSW